MTNDCIELKDLNAKTFKAEDGGKTEIDGRSWKAFLEEVLAEEFHIVRSKVGAPHQKQDKAAMIAWIEAHARESVRIDDQTAVPWCNETLGVVTCVVTLDGKDYRNVKVFKKPAQEQWQCVYWQVTQLTPD